MRRHASGIGCGARGRGMNAPPKLPGGAGAPPGETTVPCQELADGGPPGLPEARRARPPKRGLAPQSRRQGETARQKARPGAVTTLRWRAERRHVLVTARDLRPNDAPLGAPSPRYFVGARKRPRNAGQGRVFECRISGKPDIRSAYPAPPRIRVISHVRFFPSPRKTGRGKNAELRSPRLFGYIRALSGRGEAPFQRPSSTLLAPAGAFLPPAISKTRLRPP